MPSPSLTTEVSRTIAEAGLEHREFGLGRVSRLLREKQ
jgi:hypothetical protein